MTVLQHVVPKANSWCKITKYTTDKYKNELNEDLYIPRYCQNQILRFIMMFYIFVSNIS